MQVEPVETRTSFLIKTSILGKCKLFDNLPVSNIDRRLGPASRTRNSRVREQFEIKIIIK